MRNYDSSELLSATAALLPFKDDTTASLPHISRSGLEPPGSPMRVCLIRGLGSVRALLLEGPGAEAAAEDRAEAGAACSKPSAVGQ